MDSEGWICEHCGRDCIFSADDVFDESTGQSRRVLTLKKLFGIGSTDKNADDAG